MNGNIIDLNKYRKMKKKKNNKEKNKNQLLTETIYTYDEKSKEIEVY